ncbi:DUF937 domain-containing protein [Thermocoleostomius sinensis]|uniref:DUF937 domain-containing protein n=1 Tax=Thermocoleostomius sinensis A174 TaxID=2016057 RepID=A0A9E8ZE32_9CYAN|nr:DUF937 domain-containing protein [Thermocoleostomius sinensis]WAL61453.1 DUF937 domain-containing protein [Thermocoleostomius sinensis A174]
MGLFFDVLSAINNPNQQGSVAQLATITNSLQELSAGRGIQPSTMQTVMSVLGQTIRPSLQQQRAVMGSSQLDNLIGRSVGSGAIASVIQSLFPAQLQQQLAEGIAKKTGLSSTMIQSILPMLLTAVLGVFSMGARKPSTSTNAANPLLSAFLDGDRDGNTDLGDLFKFASRFINAPRAA